MPPFGTGKIPVTPVVRGRPVRLVATPDVGVPNSGVIKVGELANTAAPDPVSFVKAVSKFAEVKEPNKVVFPVLVTCPVRLALVVTFEAVKLVAVPVMFVPINADGVPKAGVINVGEVANTTAPEPVTPLESPLAGMGIFVVPSNDTPAMVRGVVNFGAEAIVITGVVVVVCTVKSELAEVTEVTVPPLEGEVLAMVILPPALVTEIPLPPVSVALFSVFPVVLPINNCPSV